MCAGLWREDLRAPTSGPSTPCPGGDRPGLPPLVLVEQVCPGINNGFSDGDNGRNGVVGQSDCFYYYKGGGGGRGEEAVPWHSHCQTKELDQGQNRDCLPKSLRDRRTDPLPVPTARWFLPRASM